MVVAGYALQWPETASLLAGAVTAFALRAAALATGYTLPRWQAED